MNEGKGSEAAKARKRWTKPVIQRFELSDEEQAALRASDDPVALLLKLKAKPGLRQEDEE